MEKGTLITVIGPTAIGKTAMAIRLAKHFKTEIISADSRQFFREMNIGTAVPSNEELNAVPHHFIQNLSIQEDYSVGDFERDALQKLEQLFKKHATVVMVGGSGLYVDAVIKGLDNFPEVDPKMRQNLKKRLEVEGIHSLQNELKVLDLVSYNQIDLDNPQRLIRALEVCLASGKPYASFLSNNKTQRGFNTIKVGLTAPRETVYNRINQRVEQMFENGLVEEARKLYTYRELNALQTVGYKELFSYFDGQINLDFAIDEIKKNTRRFAKRQYTWFKKDKETIWFDYLTKLDLIIDQIEKEIKN
ncbi:tRNA (adenosine(37)-N6)-dimethylallyltransferase MiaA [Namhaeicola litoreus]|uniref:tRNA dimethylallyltransferase n=1 Tax=Namhaeicola litoreus TaxID=1052145 RepID=A0ABW3Y402_9FLAO